MGDDAARLRLGQGFKVYQSAFYQYVVIPMNKVGTITDNLSVRVLSAIATTGTAVTDGTSDSIDGSLVDERTRNIVFQFNPPIYLTANTQYYWSLERSGTASASNYWRVAEDTGANYGDGVAYDYSTAGSYVATSPASDFCFAVFRQADRWIPFKQKRSGLDGWEYRRVGSDQIWLPYLPRDMAPVRIRGLAPLAETAATLAAETVAVPIRPEWVEAFAVNYLLGGRSGRQSVDNYHQGARTWAEKILMGPKPLRMLPPNSIRVYA